MLVESGARINTVVEEPYSALSLPCSKVLWSFLDIIRNVQNQLFWLWEKIIGIFCLDFPHENKGRIQLQGRILGDGLSHRHPCGELRGTTALLLNFATAGACTWMSWNSKNRADTTQVWMLRRREEMWREKASRIHKLKYKSGQSQEAPLSLLWQGTGGISQPVLNLPVQHQYMWKHQYHVLSQGKLLLAQFLLWYFHSPAQWTESHLSGLEPTIFPYRCHPTPPMPRKTG